MCVCGVRACVSILTHIATVRLQSSGFVMMYFLTLLKRSFE